MMDRDRQSLLIDAPDVLEQQLGLGAGIDEDDGEAGCAHARQDIRRGGEAHMPGPRQVAGGQHDAQLGRGRVRDLDEAQAPAASIGGDIGRQLRLVRDRRRQADPPRPGREAVEPREAERQQVAALGAGHGMRLVDDDRAQPREHRPSAVLRQQQRQAFRRGEQDIGRRLPLARPRAGGRVARPGLDADGQAHVGDRLRQVAGDVGRQRLERADIEGVDTGRRRARRKVDEARQEAREGFAAAGRCDEEHMLAVLERIKNIELMRARMPSTLGEPGSEIGRQRPCGRRGRRGGSSGTRT
jgi:hypothetical protein